MDALLANVLIPLFIAFGVMSLVGLALYSRWRQDQQKARQRIKQTQPRQKNSLPQNASVKIASKVSLSQKPTASQNSPRVSVPGTHSSRHQLNPAFDHNVAPPRAQISRLFSGPGLQSTSPISPSSRSAIDGVPAKNVGFTDNSAEGVNKNSAEGIENNNSPLKGDWLGVFSSPADQDADQTKVKNLSSFAGSKRLSSLNQAEINQITPLNKRPHDLDLSKPNMTALAYKNTSLADSITLFGKHRHQVNPRAWDNLVPSEIAAPVLNNSTPLNRGRGEMTKLPIRKEVEFWQHPEDSRSAVLWEAGKPSKNVPSPIFTDSPDEPIPDGLEDLFGLPLNAAKMPTSQVASASITPDSMAQALPGPPVTRHTDFQTDHGQQILDVGATYQTTRLHVGVIKQALANAEQQTPRQSKMQFSGQVEDAEFTEELKPPALQGVLKNPFTPAQDPQAMPRVLAPNRPRQKSLYPAFVTTQVIPRVQKFKPGRQHLSDWRIVLPVALITFFILLGGIFFYRWLAYNYLDASPTDKFVIAVAQFDDAGVGSTSRAANLADSMVKSIAVREEHEGLQNTVIVRHTGEIITNETEALKEAKRLRADLIIWGNLKPGPELRYTPHIFSQCFFPCPNSKIAELNERMLSLKTYDPAITPVDTYETTLVPFIAGLSQYYVGNYPAASSAFDTIPLDSTASAVTPDLVHFNKGNVYLAEREYTSAIQEYAQIKNPSPEMRNNNGVALLFVRDGQAALPQFDQAIKEACQIDKCVPPERCSATLEAYAGSPRVGVMLANRGRTRFEPLHDYACGMADLKAAVHLNDGLLSAHYDLARSLIRLANYDAAREQTNILTGKAGNDPQNWYLAGLVEALSGKDDSAAEKDFTQASKLWDLAGASQAGAPVELQHQRAQVDYGRGMLYLRLFEVSPPDESVFNQLGNRLKGKPTDPGALAAQNLQGFLKQVPDDYDGLLAYGKYLNLTNDQKSAQAEFSLARQRDPSRSEAYLQLAEIALSQKNEAGAINQWQAAVQANKFDFLVHHRLADYYRDASVVVKGELKTKDIMLEAQEIQLAYANNPYDNALALRLGTVYFQEGNLAQAFPLLESAVQHDPQNNLTHYGLGSIYWEQANNKAAQDPKEALRLRDQARLHYEQAIALKPDPADIDIFLYRLGLIYRDDLHKFPQAADYFGRATKVKPRNALYQDNLWQIKLILAEQSSGYVYGQPNKNYPPGALVIIPGTSGTIRLAEPPAYAELAPDKRAIYNQALEAARETIKLDPNNVDYNYNLAILLEGQGVNILDNKIKNNFAEAITFYRKALLLQPRDYIIEYRLATVLLHNASRETSVEQAKLDLSGEEAGKQGALSLGNTLTKAHPVDFSPAWRVLGDAYLATGNYPSALDAYTKGLNALQTTGSGPGESFSGAKALLYYGMGRADDGLKKNTTEQDYQASIASDAHFAQGYVALGDLAAARGDADGALKNYNKALEVSKNGFSQAYARLGDLHYQNQVTQDMAFQEYKSAVDRDFINLSAHAGMSRYYLDRNQLDQARVEEELVTQLTPLDGKAWNTLGQIYQRLNKLDEASTANARAKQLGQ